ncbi:MAG TPA: N-acetyltransferase [Candidatus Hydrogenedentes bacterium]|nr:N-acetyltransferase [Candidatus Hydrogenedentota bacterium]
MIRQFTENDMDAVLDIWLAASLQAHDFVAPSFWESHVKTMRTVYIPASETYVYAEGAVLSGFYSLCGNTLAALFVAPEHQDRGVGKALLAHAKAQRTVLTVSVYKENRAACRFYLAQGFNITSEQVDTHTGHPEYVMTTGG